MTDIEAKALALVNEVFTEKGGSPIDYAALVGTGDVVTLALCRAIEQHEAFKQEVDAGIKAAINALEADAKKCDCFARNEGECGCGAWCEWKSITSARAIEIVRAVKGNGA
jgi:hypothetical protein